MALEPPKFQNADKCTQCNVSFGLLTRKHHCRNCGRTFCSKCQTKETPVPKYGFSDPVRVCDACHKDITNAKTAPAAGAPSKQSAPAKAAPTPAPKAAPAEKEEAFVPRTLEDEVDSDKEKEKEKTAAAPAHTKKVSNCKCGMPLCICPADPEPEEKKEERKKTAPAHSSAAAAKKNAMAPSSFQSSFSGFGGVAAIQYDLKGDLNEQCRDAIKSGDTPGVQKLLDARADAKYCDRTGNTLVHLGAMFNRWEVVSMLVKGGADVWVKNPAGETAIDLAPTSLQHKMREFPKKTSA